jgi:List-Bact-rpt repeat protein
VRGALGEKPGWILAAVAAAFAFTLICPAAALAGSNFFFGFSADEPKGHGSSAVQPARDLGARAIRITLQWQPGATVLSLDDIAGIDRAVTTSPDLRVVVAVYGLAKNAPQSDVARDQYCSYVGNLVSLFPRVRDVLIWNEPNLSFFWKPQFNPDGTSAAPAAYEALLARCWDVLHAYDSGLNVVGFATSPHGEDNPDGPLNISHAPGTFIRKVGELYRASGRQQRLYDTFAHHAYGDNGAERPWMLHGGTHISEGDYAKLMAALSEAFSGTAQAVPGQCFGGGCVSIWYTEAGFQTTVDPPKASLYSGVENLVYTLPDNAGGEPLRPTPSVESDAPDQATQIGYAVRLAYCQPFVEGFFNFLIWDERDLHGWQSGSFWADGTPKDSYAAFQKVIGDANLRRIACEPPTTPANFAVRIDNTTTTVTWGSSSSDIGVSGYRLFRDGQFLAQISDPGYVDKNLVRGARHTYTVRAFDAAGQVSAVTGADGVSPPSVLTVEKGGTGSGRVKSESAPKIDCGSICSGTAYGGAVVTLTATADPGSIFTGWSRSCTGKADCVVSMTQDRSVKATFAKATLATAALARLSRRLSVKIAGHGTVTSSPNGVVCGRFCSAQFGDGAAVVLMAKAAPGWTFRHWGDPCGRAGKPTTCVLRLGSDTSVIATFQRPACVVPRLKRRTLRAARIALGKGHCKLGRLRRSYTPRIARGRVFAQTPRAGARRRFRAKVNLVVSLGPKPPSSSAPPKSTLER